MGAHTSYMVLLLLVATAAVVICRPQDATSNTFELGPSPVFGSFIGEIQVQSGHVAVKPRKKTTTTGKPDRLEEKTTTTEGPRFFRLIGGSEFDLGDFNPEAASVAVASGPSLSLSGPAITFNKEAQVVPVAAK